VSTIEKNEYDTDEGYIPREKKHQIREISNNYKFGLFSGGNA
jgi:hypothetical protein